MMNLFNTTKCVLEGKQKKITASFLELMFVIFNSRRTHKKHTGNSHISSSGLTEVEKSAYYAREERVGGEPSKGGEVCFNIQIFDDETIKHIKPLHILHKHFPNTSQDVWTI